MEKMRWLKRKMAAWEERWHNRKRGGFMEIEMAQQ
jgi:hypothetical protein